MHGIYQKSWIHSILLRHRRLRRPGPSRSLALQLTDHGSSKQCVHISPWYGFMTRHLNVLCVVGLANRDGFTDVRKTENR